MFPPSVTAIVTAIATAAVAVAIYPTNKIFSLVKAALQQKKKMKKKDKN